MKAKQLVRQRVEISASRFAELIIWQLPSPLAASLHSYKYRLAYVVKGICVMRLIGINQLLNDRYPFTITYIYLSSKLSYLISPPSKNKRKSQPQIPIASNKK